MKIDPDKMTKAVRHLYELSLIKNLSPERLEPLVGISHMTIYRWYRGAGPSGKMGEKILAGIKRIEAEIPDSNWGRRWNIRQSEAKRKKDEKYDAEIDRFFRELEAKVPPADRDKAGMTNDDYLGFQNIVGLAQRFDVKLPKII